ncbi:MAG: hypothetical protein IH956_05380 [Chloroflexi bacterium]|nr:hypothetical protein [Chloroflexota bacterium]
MAAIAVFVGAYFTFYRGGYDPPPEVRLPLDRINVPSSSFKGFVDEPSIKEGLFVVDAAHRNSYSAGELSTLLARVVDRGYSVEFMGDLNRLDSLFPFASSQKVRMLDEALTGADSLVVILPRDSYSDAEGAIVERFVRKGGRLLLIGDPSRRNDINSLAKRFGISFQPDFLYNQVDFDLNFQDIFIRDFRQDDLTRNLGEIVLYAASSIRSSEGALAFTDSNTRSSIAERPEIYFPMVRSADGRVVGISDLSFMIPPQNAVADNDQLVSNIADFLTTSERSFDLHDFPFFFRSEVDVLVGRASLISTATDLKNLLSSFEIDAELRGVEDLNADIVFLGLYDDSSDVVQYLHVAGIEVDEAIRTPFTKDISRDGTAIVLLHRTRDRHVLVLLGSSEDALATVVALFGTGGFRAGLVDELVGVYNTR